TAHVAPRVRGAEGFRAAGDSPTALESHDRIVRDLDRNDPRLETSPAEARQASIAGDSRTAALKYRIVENLLKVTPRYQQARRDVEPGVVGIPLEDWSPTLAAKIRARAGQPVPLSFAAIPGGGRENLRGLT